MVSQFPRESAIPWDSMAGSSAKVRVRIFMRGLQRTVSEQSPGHSSLQSSWLGDAALTRASRARVPERSICAVVRSSPWKTYAPSSSCDPMGPMRHMGTRGSMEPLGGGHGAHRASFNNGPGGFTRASHPCGEGGRYRRHAGHLYIHPPVHVARGPGMGGTPGIYI